MFISLLHYCYWNWLQHPTFLALHPSTILQLNCSILPSPPSFHHHPTPWYSILPSPHPSITILHLGYNILPSPPSFHYHPTFPSILPPSYTLVICGKGESRNITKSFFLFLISPTLWNFPFFLFCVLFVFCEVIFMKLCFLKLFFLCNLE